MHDILIATSKLSGKGAASDWKASLDHRKNWSPASSLANKLAKRDFRSIGRPSSHVAVHPKANFPPLWLQSVTPSVCHSVVSSVLKAETDLESPCLNFTPFFFGRTWTLSQQVNVLNKHCTCFFSSSYQESVFPPNSTFTDLWSFTNLWREILKPRC